MNKRKTSFLLICCFLTISMMVTNVNAADKPTLGLWEDKAEAYVGEVEVIKVNFLDIDLDYVLNATLAGLTKSWSITDRILFSPEYTPAEEGTLHLELFEDGSTTAIVTKDIPVVKKEGDGNAIPFSPLFVIFMGILPFVFFRIKKQK